MMIGRLCGGTSCAQCRSGGTGYTATTGRVIPQGGGNVLQRSGPRDINVWFGDVVPSGGNID